MDHVDKMKKEREDLEKEFNSATVDMQSKFLQALAAEGALDAGRIADENLGELFSGLKSQVEGIIENQDEVLEEIKVKYSILCYYYLTLNIFKSLLFLYFLNMYSRFYKKPASVKVSFVT